MKRFIGFLFAAFVLGSIVAQAQQYDVKTLTTGLVGQVKSSTSNAVSTAIINCTDFKEVAIMASVTGLANSTQTVTLTFAPSIDGSNYHTSERHSLVLTLAGAATKTCVTNLDVGSIGYLHLISSVYPDDAAAHCTNHTVKYVLKRERR